MTMPHGTESASIHPTRRELLSAAAGMLVLPGFLPAWTLGSVPPPSRVLRIAHIGCGRMGLLDLQNILERREARVVAVCDVDARRLAYAQNVIQKYYRTERGEQAVSVVGYRDYRELLARDDIDAVVISTPDHWHALQTIAAVQAGKDVYVQKPLALTIAESERVRIAAQASGRIVQVGSQQRSDGKFHRVCELVRNGRLGSIHTIRIGIPVDPNGPSRASTAVPDELDYERWLGPVASQPYIEERVHPLHDFERPGWMRVEDFSLGGITNWGAHHVDIAHWAIGGEKCGPTEIEARATFPSTGIWTVHGACHIEAQYPLNVRIIIDDTYPNGLRFEGSNGWIFVDREHIEAHDKSVLNTVISRQEIRLPRSKGHYADWLAAVIERRAPVAPVEAGSYSVNACAAMWIAMKLGRKVRFDPTRACFPGDPEANALCSRPRRAGYELP